MRRVTMAALLALSLGLTFAAAPLSRTFQFERRVPLEVGLVGSGGLRIDTVRFALPDAASRSAGLVRAHVSVSNTGTESRRVGLAIALFDAEGRLVGVASGGTRIRGIKPSRQQTYTLAFDHVNAAAHGATTFQISLESE